VRSRGQHAPSRAGRGGRLRGSPARIHPLPLRDGSLEPRDRPPPAEAAWPEPASHGARAAEPLADRPVPSRLTELCPVSAAAPDRALPDQRPARAAELRAEADHPEAEAFTDVINDRAHLVVLVEERKLFERAQVG
jgi:hypothetical protein